MSLTDTFIRNVKPTSSPRKYFDGEGLFLYVPPNGSKLWRMSYRFNGKTKLLSFGKYPTVGLRDARARKEEAKVMLDKGIDPSEQKKKQKEEQQMRDSIQIGDEITTIGGIMGRVVTVKEDSLIIETGADRTKMKITRWAIQTNNTAEDRLQAERAAQAAAKEAEKAQQENAPVEEAPVEETTDAEAKAE